MRHGEGGERPEKEDELKAVGRCVKTVRSPNQKIFVYRDIHIHRGPNQYIFI